jgi:2-phospho-L-lactate guanylyltransferase (CobY/MobA/RfbA family)
MTYMDKFPALILAGGYADAEMQAKYSVRYRAEILLAGKVMVQYIVDALSQASRVSGICMVGDIECENVDKVVPDQGSLVENLIAGVEECSGSDSVLVATADIPLLTAEAVDDFIERCLGLDVDFCYPIISKETIEKRFPNMHRTYARLAEGTFTGGNIVLVRKKFILEHADLIRQVMEARKDKIRLAKLIGIGTLFRTLVSQMLWAGAINLCYLECTVGRIMHAKVKVVESPYAEIGADIDTLEQMAFAEMWIKQNQSSLA